MRTHYLRRREAQDCEQRYFLVDAGKLESGL
jgi:hypothetical protein